MKSATIILLIILPLSVFVSCKSKKTEISLDTANSKASVKTTLVLNGNIDDIIRLNGKTVFLKKSAVFSSIPGYVKRVYAQYGDVVKKNDLLFEIQTKENKAMEKSDLDPQLSAAKSGIISILAPADGILSELNINSPGVYVVEGTQLCTVTENQDMMVQVNVPFEYNLMVTNNKACKVILPDSTLLDGKIVKIMPVINEASQTQNVLIKVRSNRQLPENLNVTVQFIKSIHSKAMLIPKEALLTNEIQQEFWVMKILNDSIAVKVPVTKGFANYRMVEIISSEISVSDPVIIEGAYGLPDSTIVKIGK
jgi:hypothetical protein